MDCKQPRQPRLWDEGVTRFSVPPAGVTLILRCLPAPPPAVEFPCSHTPGATDFYRDFRGKYMWTYIFLFHVDKSFPWRRGRRWIRGVPAMPTICIPWVAIQVNLSQEHHPTPRQASPQMPADVHGGKAHKTETIPQCLQPRESHSSVAPAQSLAKYQAFSLHC